MSEHTFAVEQFSWMPTQPVVAQITVQLGDETHGGAVAFRWFGERTGTPVMSVYGDAWYSLVNAPEFLALLASLNDQEVTPKSLCASLRTLGYEEVEGER